MTIRLLRGSPELKIIDGKRVLQDECVIDLGIRFQELHDWAYKCKLTIDTCVTPAMWVVGESGDGTTILRAPKGFRYDGASIPGLLQSLVMGAKENYENAGLFHDVLYQLQAPRSVSDHIFWLIARSGSKQVGRLRAWFGWAGLRIGGMWAWRAHKDKTLDVT